MMDGSDAENIFAIGADECGSERASAGCPETVFRHFTSEHHVLAGCLLPG
jgi:hypothetical protein